MTKNDLHKQSVLSLDKERVAGILLHISSLPGDFGVGDFGQADRFIEFLKQSGQRVWQILPLNITSISAGNSPYSSLSAFAGDPLFIDPYKLVKQGLINKRGVRRHRQRRSSKANYEKAENAKQQLLHEAYNQFIKEDSPIHNAYHDYKEKAKEWLDDFASFICLKEHLGGLSWSSWPEEYRYRDTKRIKEFIQEHKKEIDYIKFTQYIFDQQWSEIKHQANAAGIQIFGDMPIYVSYDSADVWANPDMFKLRSDLTMETVAGVPPDYFNEDGQYWNMPIFRWDYIKETNYDWWLKRIGRNLEWFDILRLDHFRGFSSYWEIPADEDTAKNGTWQEGPGEALFGTVISAFPRNPFIAEDLGLIDQSVYDLRDKFHMPGMRVAQFGYEGELSENIHYPPNYVRNSVAYTGTHDNNTLAGWLKNDIDESLINNFANRWNIRKGGRKSIKQIASMVIKEVFDSESGLTVIPLQDWLNLDEKSRMNRPSTTSDNWLWKVKRWGQLNKILSRKIKNITEKSERL